MYAVRHSVNTAEEACQKLYFLICCVRHWSGTKITVKYSRFKIFYGTLLVYCCSWRYFSFLSYFTVCFCIITYFCKCKCKCRYIERDTSNALSPRVSSEQIRLQVPPKLFGVDSWIPQTIGQFSLYCNVCAWHALNKGDLLTYLLLAPIYRQLSSLSDSWIKVFFRNDEKIHKNIV